jgi:hypothetical protein
MEKSFLRKMLFVVCFVFVGSSAKADYRGCNTDHAKIEFMYKDLIDSGKLKADIYGLASVLIDLADAGYTENRMIYDEVIKYFISHGCDINQRFDFKKLLTEFFPEYFNLIDKDFKLSQDEMQEEADEIKEETDKVFNSNILAKLFFYFHHGILTFVVGSDNPYLVQALIENGVDVTSFGLVVCQKIIKIQH